MKEVKLIKKIKRLLKRANIPRRLHHFGPKKYEFWQHVLALWIRQACRLSYRRAASLLEQLGFIVPSYSALCKMNKRAAHLMQHTFAQTCPAGQVVVASLDATTLSRTNPSWHYIKRIDRKKPVQQPLKLSMVVDTRRKKILGLRVRAKPRHDTQDVRYVLKRVQTPKVLVADKGYDAEWIHELAHEQGIITMIPCKKNTRKGFYRKKMQKLFRTRTYHRREMSKSLFGAAKQKYGASVSSRT
ncbi:MAG: transposase, partial [Nanoarchaeota archaeon]